MSWGFITRNFAWKLASLALSAVLWFAIVGAPELVTMHTVPILYRNLPPDLLIGSQTLDSVRLELRGPATRLSPANLADLAVQIDLAGVTGPGERTFTLSDEDLRLPEGVTFLHAVPSQVRMEFARRKSKQVPVQVRFASPPPPGYRVAGQDVSPERMEIAGPESRVDAITSAQTDAIDLSGVTRTTDIRVYTFVSDPQVWLESPSLVRVHVTIEKSK